MSEPERLAVSSGDLNSVLHSEEELCRVCRSEATGEDPLFHPWFLHLLEELIFSKCSGSIKHVHESCLKEWFKHSGKKQCELCKTQFKFTKVFSSEMPTGTLPFPLLASRLFVRIKRNLTLWFRIAVAGCVWFFWLPWTTRVSWRGLFFITDFLFGSATQPSNPNATNVLNATAVQSNDTIMAGARLFEIYAPKFLLNLTSSPTVNRILADCFEGQAMTASILCIFMMLFLLREYIEQHVPNAFEERPLEDLRPRQPDLPRNPDAEQGRNRVPVAQRELQLVPRVAAIEGGRQHVHIEHESEGEWTTEEEGEEVDRPFAGLLRSNNPEGLHPHYLAIKGKSVGKLSEITDTDTILSGTSRGLGPNSHSDNKVNLDDFKGKNKGTVEGTVFRRSSPTCSDMVSGDGLVKDSSSEETAECSRIPKEHPNSLQDENCRIELGDSSSHLKDGPYVAEPSFPSRGFGSAFQTKLSDDGFPVSLSHPTESENPIPSQSNRLDLDIAPSVPQEQLPQEQLPPQDANIRNGIWADIDRNQQENAANPAIPEAEEEGFDGVLELIGLQGPFLALFQNSIFASILMIAILGLCVFFPYVWGKTFLLLFANPLIFVIGIPLAFAKLGWDFALDLAILSFSNALCILDYVGRTSLAPFGFISNTVAEFSQTTRFSEWSMYLASSSWKRLARRFLDTPKILWQPSIINKLVPFRQKLTPQIVLNIMQEMTLLDKLLSVGMGYLLFIGLTQLYLRRTQPLISSPAGIAVERAVRTGLRQAGSLTKICIVLSIELFLFPLYSGVILDLCLLPLFENMDPFTRWYATLAFPGTSTFLHWLVGTFYMFHLSLFVSMSREIIRPGVLYFIRDPNNHEFNPIQEIVRRSFMTHLRKIAFSAVIYLLLLASCVGSLTYFIRFFVPGVLPLRWANKEFPVFDLPIDLLFYHMALPISVHFFRPGAILKSLWRWWYRFISRQLRLTSFMFNEHAPDEMGHYVRKTWTATILLQTSTEVDVNANVYYVPDGGFMRVPKRDSIALMRHRGFRMLLPVDENNRRLDGLSDEGYDDNDFQVVYTPPNFYRRVMVFVFCVWLFAAASGVCFTVGPLLFGRYFFRWAFGHRSQVSDVYALLCGFYAMGTTIVAADYSNRLLKKAIEYREYMHRRPVNTTEMFQHARVASYRFLKVLYLLVLAFIVFPVFLAFIINFYLVVPIQTYLQVESSIQVMHTWILGVVYVKLGIRLLLLADGRLTGRRLREVVQNGWTDPDVTAANRWFVFPLGGAMIAALTIPVSIGWIANNVLFRGAPATTSEKVYRYSYPIALGVLMGILLVQVVVRLMRRWADGIREEIWLVGERLHNIDDEDVPGQIIRVN